jgi:DNA-binding transcriptional regulator GbsR (MarR family)
VRRKHFFQKKTSQEVQETKQEVQETKREVQETKHELTVLSVVQEETKQQISALEGKIDSILTLLQGSGRSQ